jgi:hypothetical protein
MTHPLIQCRHCIHFVEEDRTCAAFPKGVPEVILYGKRDHTKPYRGDGGIRFEPIKRKE